MNHVIVKRKYYAFEIVLDSPLSILSGYDIHTDMDILRNGQGEVFVPGTSVAGAFRNYLGLKKNEPGILGFSDDTSACMSPVNISDIYFKGNTVVSVRDGIHLGEDKIVLKGGKFDQEMIETGAAGMLYISCTFRDREASWKFDQTIRQLLRAVDEGEIRFGARKNRGYGRFRVNRVYEAEFDASSAERWLDFEKAPKAPASYHQESDFKDWVKMDGNSWVGRYIFMTVPLRLTGGISIRRYSAGSSQADYEQITCNGRAVIPGSSWNGLIRWEAADILRELGCRNVKNMIERWFGYMNEEDARQSMVLVGESVLEGETAVLPMTRTKVDRFTAAAKSGGLYTEISYIGGHTDLRIGVRKDEAGECQAGERQALLGLLLLIVEDIQEGYGAVGGQAAVGRGIFSSAGEVTFSEKIEEQECRRALAQWIRKEAGI